MKVHECDDVHDNNNKNIPSVCFLGSSYFEDNFSKARVAIIVDYRLNYNFSLLCISVCIRANHKLSKEYSN